MGRNGNDEKEIKEEEERKRGMTRNQGRWSA